MPSNGTRYVDLGLLLIRVGMGALAASLGYPLLEAGAKAWNQIGESAMEPLGVTFAFQVWGFLGALTLTAGGAFTAVGIVFRPGVVFLALTSAIGAHMVYSQGQDIGPSAMGPGYGYALAGVVVFLGLLITGSGEYALGRAIKPLDGKWYQ